MGCVWLDVSNYVPSGSRFAMAVDPRGEKATFYLLADDGFYSKREGEEEWQAFPRPTRTHGFGDYEGVGGKPLWVRIDPFVQGRLFRAVEVSYRRMKITIVTVSPDGGKSWYLIDDIAKDINKMSFKEKIIALRKGFIRDVYTSPLVPDLWFALKDNKVLVSKNAGKTWKTAKNTGLDIPLIRSLMVPRNADEIYVGTPAGMYASYDNAETWQGTSLITFGGNGVVREEIGGIAYLTAYWMGRYHGFISDKEAERVWR